MTEENGYLVDYDNIYEGLVIPVNGLPKKKIIGNKVFTKEMQFDGLLDLEKLACWNVEEDTLVKLEPK